MKKHKLLLYEQISRRVRGKLVWLGLVLLLIAVYDQFNPVLGDAWFLIWLVLPLVAILWLYYAVLMRRAAVQVRPKYLRLQGPFYAAIISYGRIHSTTSAHMEQHFARKELKGSAWGLLEPLYQQTCLFIELKSYPPYLKRRHLWFPRYLFGTSRPGLLCAVEDWLALSHDIEAARTTWQAQRERDRRGDARSLAARVLEERADFR